jgi:hypothetical protein
VIAGIGVFDLHPNARRKILRAHLRSMEVRHRLTACQTSIASLHK